ncbi:hydrophobin [Agaricus bisporus var. bisporus H97]|uniref:hydrophobin n=1 Tax=Agaricus bisporus var. bisporus (strain H97 / ATCC MYA-4626 / FGSC 10389) TaxID=936046 RepID=UPI00029F54D6|nr:hydrophobin [Agaricus bisporus var. bisporus H97]EKV52035.1 hydrophobin [Agaricus bisporus var. bisporus H97]
MNFKFLALIAFATAVIAAPASEDVLADFSDPHPGAPETAGTRLSTSARDDLVQTESYQARPNSYDPRQDRQCRRGFAQCCNRLQQASQDAIAALLALGNYSGLTFDPATTSPMIGLECIPFDELFGTCSSTPVCCNNIEPTGRLAIGCRPLSFS